jgi:hypothetical protein
MAPPKGQSNNPRGNPRGNRNAKMTKREEAALEAENSGNRDKTVAAIVGRALFGGNR